MNFTKPMIDLAKEIRRRAPTEVKPSIKMANPELFVELAKIFDRSKDTVMKALIKEICSLAEQPWSQAELSETQEQKHSVKDYIAQIAQTSLNKAPEKETPAEQPKKIYRGRVVHS